MFGEAEVALRSDYFFDNGAEHGGAVVMRGNLTVQVEDCVFKSNAANNYGGGVTLTVRVAAFDWFFGCAAFFFFFCAAACHASLVVVVMLVVVVLLVLLFLVMVEAVVLLLMVLVL